MGQVLAKRIKERRKKPDWRGEAKQAHSVHDRRSNDVPKAGQYAAIEVDDPLALEKGDKIVVLRQLRNDPLARLHSHHQIDDAQYLAGRAYQRDWEIAERGSRGIDPTREAVDGGQLAEPLTEQQQRARKRLIEIEAVLGRLLRNIVHGFLIERQHIYRIAPERFDRKGDRWANYYGKLLRDGLGELAIEYGLAMRPK